MAEILYSKILKLTEEDAEKVKQYCIDHELRYMINPRDRSDLKFWAVVWGTKRELKEFDEYF